MTAQTPETLGHSRSGRSSERPGTAPSVPVPAVPPPYRAEQPRNPGTNTPTWLADKINNSRRAAHPRTCPRCDADTLLGPDHDTCARIARVDPNPVDPIREVIALLAGRASYDLIGPDLYYREPEHIHAARNPYPIHLEHRCEKGQLW